MAHINLAMRVVHGDRNRSTQTATRQRFIDDTRFAHSAPPYSGTPGSCLAVRIVSEVLTLSTLGAGVSEPVRNS